MQIDFITDQHKYREFWLRQNGHFMQSFEWQQLKGGYLFIVDDGFVFSVLIRELPIFGKYGYSPKLHLPLTIDPQAFFINLQKKLETVGIKLLLVDPGAELIGTQISVARSAEATQPQFTNIVDLQITSEQLWDNLKSNYRRNINKSTRSGVSVFEISNENEIPKFHKLLTEVAKFAGFTPPTINQLTEQWELFRPFGEIKIFLASLGEEIVGGYLLMFDNQGAYELYGGVNSLGRKNEAGYLLKWTTICAALEYGRKFYDHWGVAPFNDSGYDQNHTLSRISEFKKGFGGKDIKFADSYAIASDSYTYELFNLLTQVKSIYGKFRKLFSN